MRSEAKCPERGCPLIIDARDRFPLKKAKLEIIDDRIVDSVKKAQAWESAREAYKPDLEQLRKQNNEENTTDIAHDYSDGRGIIITDAPNLLSKEGLFNDRRHQADILRALQTPK